MGFAIIVRSIKSLVNLYLSMIQKEMKMMKRSFLANLLLLGHRSKELMRNTKKKTAEQRLEEKAEIKQEIKQETNLDYYKDEILESCLRNLAVVKGKPKLCPTTNCSDCNFKGSLIGCHKKVADWLKHPHGKPVYKLTKFEKELLQCYPDIYSFKVFNSLNGMKEKGYFKGIDDNELIGEILAKCEVV